MVRFTYLTIHPDLFRGFIREGLLFKAVERGQVEFAIVNPRDFAEPPHYRVDDKPFGGGPGMILKCEPIARALEEVKTENSCTILLSAKGKQFTQKHAEKWTKKYSDFIFICGRYEGVDERIAEYYADEEVRIGNFVLMGGEVAAMAITESVARLMPGVIGNPESLKYESHSEELLTEYAQYTRPREFEGHAVPEALTSGNHKDITAWRLSQGRVRKKSK